MMAVPAMSRLQSFGDSSRTSRSVPPLSSSPIPYSASWVAVADKPIAQHERILLATYESRITPT